MSISDAPFFNGMVAAFADHRPVRLSPDVVWMLVSQAFSQEVNADSERFRKLFVDFDGWFLKLLPFDKDGNRVMFR